MFISRADTCKHPGFQLHSNATASRWSLTSFKEIQSLKSDKRKYNGRIYNVLQTDSWQINKYNTHTHTHTHNHRGTHTCWFTLTTPDKLIIPVLQQSVFSQSWYTLSPPAWHSAHFLKSSFTQKITALVIFPNG